MNTMTKEQIAKTLEHRVRIEGRDVDEGHLGVMVDANTELPVILMALRSAEPAQPRRDGHSALRVKDGEIETFDPHPETRPLRTRFGICKHCGADLGQYEQGPAPEGAELNRRAATLLDTAGTVGIVAFYDDGTRTPNGKLCLETAALLKAQEPK